MFQVIDGCIYYQHRLVARLEPGLNGLLEREITEALEGGIEAAAYDRGFDAGCDFCAVSGKEPEKERV